MIERTIDFAVQIITQTFLADDDHWFQFESVALGAKPFGLYAGQFHFFRSATEGFRLKNAHGTTGPTLTNCRLPDGLAIGQDADYVTI